MVFVHSALFIVGLVLLIKGSDFFVDASSRIAKSFGVSQFVIGLTLVAIGTSVPELAASVVAALRQEASLIIGNVVGSNIANIGLIIGLSAAVSAIKTKQHMLQRDGYIMMFISVVFFLFVFNGLLSRFEAIIFFLLYVAYLAFLLSSKKDMEKLHFRGFLQYFLTFNYMKSIKKGIVSRWNKQTPGKKGSTSDFFIILLSVAAIVLGARMLVNEAVWFAQFFDVSAGLIGLSIVAVGTSLPELSVSVSAARKGYGGMVLGNVLGSNIANFALILGVSALITPLAIEVSVIKYTAPFMLFISALLLIFIRSQWRIRRLEGVAFVVLYVFFMFLVFLSGI